MSIYPHISIPTINSLYRAGGWAQTVYFMLKIRKYENDAFCIFPLGGYSKGERLTNLNVSRKVRNGFLVSRRFGG